MILVYAPDGRFIDTWQESRAHRMLRMERATITEKNRAGELVSICLLNMEGETRALGPKYSPKTSEIEQLDSGLRLWRHTRKAERWNLVGNQNER